MAQALASVEVELGLGFPYRRGIGTANERVERRMKDETALLDALAKGNDLPWPQAAGDTKCRRAAELRPF